jgi:hypothetical protein
MADAATFDQPLTYQGRTIQEATEAYHRDAARAALEGYRILSSAWDRTQPVPTIVVRYDRAAAPTQNSG